MWAGPSAAGGRPPVIVGSAIAARSFARAAAENKPPPDTANIAAAGSHSGKLAYSIERLVPAFSRAGFPFLTIYMPIKCDVDPAALQAAYPQKFRPEAELFAHVHRGDRIFIHTGCAEPQYLVNAMVRFAESNPKAFVDTELYHVWTLGLAPYTDAKFKRNFRHNSFFIANNTRDAVNAGLADYTPVYLSNVPALFRRGLVRFDVALIQVSPPDSHGYVSLGVSVDIVKAAVENSELIVAQVNPQMPRVHGDGFLHLHEIDYAVFHDEPLLEFSATASSDVVERIGDYCARVIQDGDTIQVGYGSIPNAVVHHLRHKQHLGIHTELLGDGLAELIRLGVIDNSRKTVDRGKTVAAFCMGSAATYDLVHDNPSIVLRGVDYTNNPLLIARQQNMVAINSALELDLTGQCTADSLGQQFFSGVGGQADFMRGAVLAPGGRTILALPATACDGAVSRIVPFLQEGAGVTLCRGDVHYVITEHGVVNLHGRSLRERALGLISVAAPEFRAGLEEAAVRRRLL
jgi:acyl-CoA hydrolase